MEPGLKRTEFVLSEDDRRVVRMIVEMRSPMETSCVNIAVNPKKDGVEVVPETYISGENYQQICFYIDEVTGHIIKW